MNREQKRMAKRMGQTLTDDGRPMASQRDPRQQRSAKRPRVGPIRFLKEVFAELKKVAWPTRSEVINYTFVTIGALIFVGLLIFVLDSLFVRGAQFLFK